MFTRTERQPGPPKTRVQVFVVGEVSKEHAQGMKSDESDTQLHIDTKVRL